MAENEQRLLINNSQVNYKPDSLVIAQTEASYTVQAKQNGTKIGSSNFFNGKTLDKISFETINDEEARKLRDNILIDNSGIIDISVSTDDRTSYMLGAGSTDPIEEKYAAEGDITGFSFTSKKEVARKIT